MISVILATHNEEKNLERCLDSVKDFADEIILVDGESTDATVEIAKKFKAKIIKTTNKQNFHINKQMGMDKAKGELVLQMDADEEVDSELAKFIKDRESEAKKILKRGINDSDTVAWWLKRKNNFLGHWLKKGGQYPDPVIRLYIKGMAKLPRKDVHEQMTVKKGQVGWAEGHLLHYSNPRFSDYMLKFNRYTSFTAQLAKDRGQKATFLGAVNNFTLKPLYTFLLIFIRHKGFVDGFYGFLFSVMSALHHPVSYLKLWELYVSKKN